MSKHQIIYTSCMRGIDGINDGQQIFSYDADFRKCKSDEIKSLFTYQVPLLESGVVMTEELALTMPQAYSYRLLNNGMCAISLNTYLGRDYMGSSGRFGNHLSHSIVCDTQDLNLYPCELYGNDVLRSHMDYEEVNNPNPPDYLLEPKLEKGYKVDIDSVVEFLGVGNRMHVYVNMLHALLVFESEHKRIVICDETENIIMWIAALEYALPLEIVKKTNFTTYEYDPELSASQICGVISSGSKYNVQRYFSSGQHFVFDLLDDVTHEFDKNDEFLDFVDTAMSFSYDSLQAFHKYLLENYTYREATEEIYSAYILYMLRSDGIENISKQAFEKAIEFEKKYASLNERQALIRQVLNEIDIINGFDNDYVLSIIRFLLDSFYTHSSEDKEKIRMLIVDRILVSFANSVISEKEFLNLYNTIDNIAKQVNLNIAIELMKIENKNKLDEVMQHGVCIWKNQFIIRILCDYIKANNVGVDELNGEHPTGQFFARILSAAYKMGTQEGNLLVRNVLDQLSDNWNYLTNMALDIEGYLMDMSLGKSEVDSLWSYYYKVFIEKQNVNRNKAIEIFNQYDRFEQMYELFKCAIDSIRELSTAREMFKEYFEEWFDRNTKFRIAYLDKVLNKYFDFLLNKSNNTKDDILENYMRELLVVIMNARIDTWFIEDLITIVVVIMPMQLPNKENAKLLKQIFEYMYNFKHKKISGKTLLLLVGMIADKVTEKKDFSSMVSQINDIAGDGGINICKLGNKAAYEYLEWILTSVIKYSTNAEEMKDFYNLFQMTSITSSDYFNICSREFLKQSRDDKDYKGLCEFLKFLSEMGNSQDRENTGKVLCKLSKQKLDELDKYVNSYFDMDKNAQKTWDEVYKVAAKTNPLLNNISNIFKRKKI